ncbi:MAG TPA: hypothetical protein VLK27_02025, partial [Chthoniobacterales bacterium]|nr:hypothetical protein [Chthoniobacterales bacterium]
CACLPTERLATLRVFMPPRTAMLVTICGVVARLTFAGDAVAIGYNYDGVWTAVTYNRSSTPKGGPNYHDSAQACQFAARDLWARATEYLVRTEIIGQSDRTGYVAVAQGKAIERNKDVTAVGRGKSQNQADSNALKLLNGREATTETEIVYRYFSYGSDSGGRSRAKRSSRRVATSQITKRRT